ncbi:MAG: rod shape-determining protein MreD [Bdellovibrionales bacterium]|nr:rod shape-determining protein MreD [Bdellovibrionales bacterium]
MAIKLPFTLQVLMLGILGVLLQEIVLDIIFPAWLPVPHVLVVFLVLLGFSEHTLRGCLLVFCLGFLLDLNAGNLLGPWAGAFMVTFVLLAVLAQRIYVDSVLTLVAMVSLADFVTTTVYYGLVTFVPENFVFAGGKQSPWIMIALQALVSGLFAPVVARFCKFSTVHNKVSTGFRNQYAHEGKGLW